MSTESSAGIHLVGVTHDFVGECDGEGNYLEVKGYLEKIQPSFVTIEFRLSAYSLKYSGIIEILKATPEELDRLERLMLEESGSDGEYHAAAAYCRRNNVPLFLIDDNGVIPPEELARIDVTQIDDLVAFCEERGMLGYSSRTGDLTSRNIFMGSVISEVARRFSGRGVHVGGANHIISEEGMVLTDTIRAPIVGSEIFSLSRRYIN